MALSPKEIYNDFMTYFENREVNEQKPERFLEVLDMYIAKVDNELEKNHLLDFLRQFEFSIKHRSEFPKYIISKIAKKINELNLQVEKLSPIEFLSINKDDEFFDYLKERELKFFSKLIPQPATLILKHYLKEK